MSLNLVIIEGRLGRDPETTQVGQSSVTKVAVATSERWNDRQTGEKRERTTWHNVEAWGKTGEIIQQYFKKGDGIGIQGSTQVDEYEKNGEKRFINKVKAQSFWFPVASSQGGQTQNNQGYQQQPMQQQQYQQQQPGQQPPQAPQGFNNQLSGGQPSNAKDDDIPFMPHFAG